MWSHYIMNLTFILLTVILFILTQPGLFITIPTKHMLYFVILHGVLFTGLYMYVKEYFTAEKEIEGFDETEEGFFQDISKKLDKIFSEYTFKEMVNLTIEEFEGIIVKEFPDLSPEQIVRLRQYKDYKKGEDDKKTSIDEDKKELATKLEYIFNKSSVEQIQYFDSLSEERQSAFERLVDNMTMENIDKYLKLNVAKIKESVQEVVELSE